ncbi:MAG: ATP-binding protein [Cytophagales bacterium]
MIKRAQYQILAKRLKEPNRLIQAIYGPRQIGKTTLVRQVLSEHKDNHLMVSADDTNSNPAWIDQQWSIAREKAKKNQAPDYILAIDEIQKIGNWSEAVKKNWDLDIMQDTRIKVLLLGSSRLLLQQGLTESLAGRFETIFMGHWSFNEMHEAFGWDANTYTWYGGYPGAANFINDTERWRSYVADSLIESSISRDILMLTRVDKPALMRKLFELGCSYSGQILSLTKIQGQLQDAGNTTTLANYLHLLNTAGLLNGLEKYSPNKLIQRSSSPKFQVHNNSLLSIHRSESLQEAINKPELWGRMVESAIGAYLLNESIRDRFNVYYWRHRNYEIDFVLEQRGRVIGLEIKSGHRQKASGMAAFQKEHKPDKVLLIGGRALPWEEFLKLRVADLF